MVRKYFLQECHNIKLTAYKKILQVVLLYCVEMLVWNICNFFKGYEAHRVGRKEKYALHKIERSRSTT